MFFKVVAGVLSTLALATGTAMAIPESREFLLNTIAPYSQVYEEQKDKTQELENANNTNLETLNKTREALSKAEQQSLTYQTNLSTAQSSLLSAKSELDTNISQLNVLQTNYDNAQIQISNLQNSLDNANFHIMQLNNDLVIMNQEYMNLQDLYNQALMNGDQQIIDDLNMQVSNLVIERDILNMQLNDKQMEVDNLYMQLDMERIDRDFYEMRIMDMQMEIDMLNNDIMMKYEEITQLQMDIDRVEQEKMELQTEINNQQEIIDQLNMQLTMSFDWANYSISFENANSFDCKNSDDEIVLSYVKNETNNIDLIDLIGKDFTGLHINNLSGTLTSTNITFTIASSEFNPTIFLRNANGEGYVEFNPTNLQALIVMGYTSVDYVIYNYHYSNGITTCHLNFNQFH